MKKRIICLVLVLIMILTVSSCVVSKTRYDYNMEKYVSLVDYSNYEIELVLDSIQAAIDSSIMDYATEYTVQVGDEIYVDVIAKEVKYVETEAGTLIDQKGEEIAALKEENLLLKVGSNEYASKVENSILGTKIGEKTQLKIQLPDDFKVEEYRGTEVYIDITVKSKMCKEGDVVLIKASRKLKFENLIEGIKENNE